MDSRGMDAGDWIALVATVIALAAATFAGLSWRQSRRSANASERSASASERSVAVAERAEEARQAPKLEFRAKRTVDSSGTYVVIVLVDGPPEVDIRATGVWIKDTPVPGQRTTLGRDGGTSRVSIKGQHPVPVDLRSREGELTVEVEVECTEVNTSNPRTWTRTGTVRFPAPPPRPATSPAEPPPTTPAHGLFRDLGD